MASVWEGGGERGAKGRGTQLEQTWAVVHNPLTTPLRGETQWLIKTTDMRVGGECREKRILAGEEEVERKEGLLYKHRK